MDEIALILFGLIALTGAAATLLTRKSYDKLISLGIMIGGIMPFIADRGFLDVLAAVAIIAPLSTIFILMCCRKGGKAE